MKALIFDFDGLIVDTEVAEFEAWREVYAGHGAELTLEVWADVVGSAQGYFDPVAYLEGLIGRPVDRAKVQAQRRRRTMEIIEELPILPGVLEYLDEARDRGLLLGVASNSSHEWVEGHLARKGLLDRFDVIRCAEDVEKAKPAPDLYLSALSALDARPDEAIAFEDSPHGARAAVAAGIYCVAVPSTLTKHLDFSFADLKLNSLADLPLADLIRLAKDAERV